MERDGKADIQGSLPRHAAAGQAHLQPHSASTAHSTSLSLTFLIHHTGAWEFTRPKKALSTKVNPPSLEFPHLNAQRVWMNVFP